MRLSVPFQIRPTVVQANFALLQKPIQFITGFQAEKTAKLGRADLSFAVSLQRDRFQRRP